MTMKPVNKRITSDGKTFTDRNGKKVIPHGINMVCKDKSRGYIGYYEPEDFSWLRKHGFNIIRLGIFWDAVEPEPGRYDDDYLDRIEDTVAMAAAEDICVYLDMHQDLYGVRFEDGAPEWATLTDGCTHVRTELWSESYLESEAVQHAFDNFWKNAPAADGVGLQEHYADMWRHVAARFAGNEYVIGYDLMNEPFPGSSARDVIGALFTEGMKLLGETAGECTADTATDTSGGMDLTELLGTPEGRVMLLERLGDGDDLIRLVKAPEAVTGEFEEKVLTPFYSKVAAAIREADPVSLIMFESNYFANAGIPSHVGLLTDREGRTISGQVYAPHGYDILVDTEAYDGADTSRVDLIFASLAETAGRLGLPVIIGEWGCFPNAGDSQVAAAMHLRQIFTAMGAGDTYYDFSHIYSNRIIEALV